MATPVANLRLTSVHAQVRQMSRGGSLARKRQQKMHTYSRQSPPRQLSELPRFPEIEGKGSLEAGATDAPTLDQALVKEVVINRKGPSRAARLHTVWRRAALAMPPLQIVAAAKAHHLKSTVRRTARAGMQRKQKASVLQSFARSGKDHSWLLLPQLLEE